MKRRKEGRKKGRNDEEAITLGTTLEQRFAIGLEAGGGADMFELIQQNSQPIYAFAEAHFYTN